MVMNVLPRDCSEPQIDAVYADLGSVLWAVIDADDELVQLRGYGSRDHAGTPLDVTPSEFRDGFRLVMTAAEEMGQFFRSLDRRAPGQQRVDGDAG